MYTTIPYSNDSFTITIDDYEDTPTWPVVELDQPSSTVDAGRERDIVCIRHTQLWAVIDALTEVANRRGITR